MFTRIRAAIAAAESRETDRRAYARLLRDDALLRDIGLTRATVERALFETGRRR